MAAASRFGAFVDGIELFDAGAFGMSAPEAAAADPQHRLLLQLTGEQQTSSLRGNF
jgi:acyl transferase domain-containing protein